MLRREQFELTLPRRSALPNASRRVQLFGGGIVRSFRGAVPGVTFFEARGVMGSMPASLLTPYIHLPPVSGGEQRSFHHRHSTYRQPARPITDGERVAPTRHICITQTYYIDFVVRPIISLLASLVTVL